MHYLLLKYKHSQVVLKNKTVSVNANNGVEIVTLIHPIEPYVEPNVNLLISLYRKNWKLFVLKWKN